MQISCPHCRQCFAKSAMLKLKRHRNVYGIDEWTCSGCGGQFKFDPYSYVERRDTDDLLEGVPLSTLLPAEELAQIDMHGEVRPRRPKRYVPLIWGVLGLGGACWFLFGFTGWWRYIPAGLLLAFAWPSLKTAFGASDREIRELTEETPMSEETSKRFGDRI